MIVQDDWRKAGSYLYRTIEGIKILKLSCMNLKRLPVLLLLLVIAAIPLSSFAQKTVSGKVIDPKTNTGLQGVNIKVKNGTQATITDVDGNFTIVVPSSESILVFTHVNYSVYETKAGNGPVNVTMKETITQLDDVVVVGYGTQKRTHLTGSVGTVDMKRVEDIPVGNLSEALKGQIVGVSVSGGFARPGEVATITIRNPLFFSKDGGSKDPLFVIDDIIRTKADFDLLDASEVENISVLKDAAAAIYGILGSNGVIIVKTKRGKPGSSSISYSSSYGISDAKLPSMLNGIQEATYLNDLTLGQKNWDTTAASLATGYFSPTELDYIRNHPDNNWLKMAWQPSHEMRQTLNISGGTEKASFFAGFTYNDQNSNFDGLRYKRYSFRSSSDIKVAAGLKLGLSISGSLGDRKNTFNKQGNESLDNDWKTLVTESPFYAPYINGLPILIPSTNTNSNINNYNYFAVHALDNYTSTYNSTLNFQGSLTYDIPFIKGLRAGVNFNKNVSNSWGKQYGTKYNVYSFNYIPGANGHIYDTSGAKALTLSNGDRVRLNPTITNSYQFNATVNYDRTFGKHQLGAFFGYEQSETSSDGVAGMLDGVVVGGLDNQNFATGTQLSSETVSEGGRLAVIGRLNYSYSNKYLLEVSFRGDASANFAPENRWGYFPSFSAGWVISEEKFFRNSLNIVNFLKLRGSVGFLGLDATKSYQWLRSYNIQTGKAAVYNGNTDRGLAVVSNVDLANRDVHWDNVDKYNVGIDARFFKNRLSLSADGFINRLSNMLSNLTSSPSILIGTAVPTENFGRANTFGFEASTSWRDKINKDWGYNVTLNFNWMDNKVLVTDVAKGNIGTYLDPTGKSQDLGFLGYHSLGILRSQAEVDAYVAQYHITNMLGYIPGSANPIRPGMLAFADVRGKQDPVTLQYAGPDGIIDINDQDYLKRKQDNHYGLGINWGVTYKALSLNVVMGMNWGGIGSIESSARKIGQTYYNRPDFWADHWTPNNTNAAYPSPFYSSSYDLASDFWWKSSFSFRVSTLNLSYSLPQQIVKKIKMNSARVYFVSTNPFNFYNPYSYKDNANGSFDVFPVLSSYSLGLNVNL